MILNGRENLTGPSGLLVAIIAQAFKDAMATGKSDAALAAKRDAIRFFSNDEHLVILDALDYQGKREPLFLLDNP